jgi:hypothetical protein
VLLSYIFSLLSTEIGLNDAMLIISAGAPVSLPDYWASVQCAAAAGLRLKSEAEIK